MTEREWTEEFREMLEGLDDQYIKWLKTQVWAMDKVMGGDDK